MGCRYKPVPFKALDSRGFSSFAPLTKDSQHVKDSAYLSRIPTIVAMRKNMRPIDEPPDLLMMAPPAYDITFKVLW